MYWKSAPLLYPPSLRPRVRRGRGVLQGEFYRPWLFVRDVPSKGTSLVSSGILTGRPHHLLSELEAIYFFLTERRTGVIDIREQWPILETDRTLELCAEMKVRHKLRLGSPEPFTIDFLITEQAGGVLSYRAASVKSVEDAKDPEIRLRLAVEYRWCSERGIPWTLVDTSRFNKTLLQNLRFLRSWFRHRYEPTPALETQFLAILRSEYTRNELLRDLVARVATASRLPLAQAEDMFRYCTWHDRIKISLSHPIALDKPLILLDDTCHA